VSARTFATFDPSLIGAHLELEQSRTVLTYNASADIHRQALLLEPKASGIASAEILLWGDAAIANAVSVGLTKSTTELDKYVGETTGSYGYRVAEGAIYNDDASIASVTAGDKGQIIGIDLDLTDSTAPVVTWSLDGTPLITQALPDTGPWYLAVTLSGSTGYDLRAMVNTGQRAFEYGVRNRIGWLMVQDSAGMLRIGERGYISATNDTAPNARYRGALAGNARLTVRRSLNFWTWRESADSNSAQSSRGELDIANGDGFYDGVVGADIRDAQVRVLLVDDDDESKVDDAEVIASMIVEDVKPVDDTTISFALADPLAQLDVALQTRLVRPDADESVANAVWPISLGAVRSIEPLQIDGQNLVFALHDGAVLGLGAVRTSGDKLDPSVPDYSLTADGLLTLANPPVGKPTADLSSIGGDVPGGPDDVLGGDGSFDDAAVWDFSGMSNDVGEVSGGKMTLAIDNVSGPVYYSFAKHDTWRPDPAKLYRIVVTVDGCNPLLGSPGHEYSGAELLLKHGASESSPYPNTTNISSAVGTIGRVSSPGTYTFVWQPWAANPFFLCHPQVRVYGDGTESTLYPTSVIISDLKIYEVDIDPVDDESLVPITLQALMRELIEDRRGWAPSTWSAEDAAAIDTATGYAGVGFHARDATTISVPLRQALDSYWASAYRSRSGVIRVARLRAPELVDEGEWLDAITVNDLTGDIAPYPDFAPGLSTQVVGRRNWMPLAPSEIVTDTDPVTGVTLAERAMLGRDYRLSAVYSGALPGSLAHARYAPAFATLLDKQVDIQAFADYAGVIYPPDKQRMFYPVPVKGVRRFDLDQVRPLIYPRYGLDAGKPVLIVDITEEHGTNNGTLICWG
jgi:hypothetical protein